MQITSLKRRSNTSLKYFAYEELNTKCKIHYWKIIKTQIPVNFKLLRTDSAPLPKKLGYKNKVEASMCSKIEWQKSVNSVHIILAETVHWLSTSSSQSFYLKVCLV